MLTVSSTKTCEVCRKEFPAWNSIVRVCGIACARKVPVIDKKAARELLLKRKEAVKTRSEHMKETQIAFNTFIRTRDRGLPCICCGAPLADGGVGGGFDCGHYRSVGSAPHLRFDERNAHGQTKRCNRYGSGRAVDYRLGLIQRIGREAVEELESDNSSPKFTIAELQELKAKYRALTRQLLKEKEA